MSAIRFESAHRHFGGVRPASARHRTRSVAARIWAMVREWRRRARDRASLASLDDRMLADIGITRTDAEFLINKPFWKE